jgi:hypothetical protein
MSFNFGELESRAVSKVVAMTATDTTYDPGRWFVAIATGPGNVSVRLAGGQDRVYPVTIGVNVFPFAATRVNAAGTTATASFENWL